ncbi:MAG: ComEA family DNA-binding protein [Anaerolineales bacterium]|nr:ComEA family DNA-binding protein [Anaerolineales bacterium]
MDKKTSLWQTILLSILGTAILIGAVLLASRQPRGQTITLPEAPPEAGITVDVDGAVALPGVYELPAGSRVEDAIEAAGGLLNEAYSESLNMAAPLSDGTKVLVPLRPPAAGISQDDITASDTTAYGSGFPININTADKNTLTALPGIGETKAQAIIDYRNENGPFTHPEQLMEVSGIGEATYQKLKDLITIY